MTVATSDIHRTIDAVWRIESAKLIGSLARIVRDVGLAEDLAQDALVIALERMRSRGRARARVAVRSDAGATEVVAPVELPELQRELQQILDIQLNDRRDAWDMQSDGTYIQRMPGEGDDPRGSQQILIELAERRQKEARRLKKRKPKGIARRPIFER